jgi:alanyl-tRNA synthetase
MTITDGSLPANVGGGGNVRNILRRVFSILEKNDWWKKIPMQDFLKLFEMHKKDLEGIIGAFAEYKSFDDIIKVEWDRWKNTDEVQRKNLEKLLKQRKSGQLTIDDWIVAMQSWGIPADSISEISKQPIPGNLYYEIA